MKLCIVIIQIIVLTLFFKKQEGNWTKHIYYKTKDIRKCKNYTNTETTTKNINPGENLAMFFFLIFSLDAFMIYVEMCIILVLLSIEQHQC